MHIHKLLPFLVIYISPALALAELVDNPLYVEMAKAKVGTTIHFKPLGGPNDPAPPPNVEFTMRLTKITPEAVTIELSSPGAENQRTMSTEVPNKIEKGEEAVSYIPGSERGQFAIKSHDAVKDKLDINGKSTDCTRYEAVAALTPRPNAPAGMDQPNVTVKLWIATSLPGGLAKMEFTQDAAHGQPPRTQALVGTAWDTPDNAAPGAAATAPATAPARPTTAPAKH